MKRRTFLKWTGLTAIGASAVSAGGYGIWRIRGEKVYRNALDALYRPADTSRTDRQLVLREIARYATMAPNSHNTQPWRIALEESALVLRPDLSRACPIVDPDDHHVYVSLGCAAENAVHAATAFGLRADVSFDELGDRLRIDVSPALERRSSTGRSLFEAITERQSTRRTFDGVPLANDELGRLEDAGRSSTVRLQLVTEKAELESLLDLVVEGNRRQMETPAFVAELRHWIRTSYFDAVSSGDGLFTPAGGNPALPSWIGKEVFDLAYKEPAETEKYTEQMRSSAGVAIFATESESKRNWIEVGRRFERFALEATSMGILHSHVNQPVEVATLRSALAGAFDLGGCRPDLVVRFGRGKALPKSLRRPLEEVIDA